MMTAEQMRTALQLRSHVKNNHELELSLVDVPIPEPAEDEVLVRVEATPINPSDLGLLIGAADLTSATFSGSPTRPVVTAPIPDAAWNAMSSRAGVSVPVGNEGAGVVVAAGASAQAQALLGVTVAAIGGAMYSQYRAVKVEQCLPLPAGTTAAQGASCFVNPLTALGMVETMRLEGHSALVHTAAASNLGQMLNKICISDGISLVNIVRSAEQAAVLRHLGAVHICDSSTPDFLAKLTEALVATGATLAFDAIGGGPLAGQIVACMESALLSKEKTRGVYGSPTHKQVYIYGRLNGGTAELTPARYGMAWGVGGWLLFPFLNRVGAERAKALRERVVAELTTTFASHYAQTVSLAEALQPDAIRSYSKRATGAKYLIAPHKGVPNA